MNAASAALMISEHPVPDAGRRRADRQGRGQLRRQPDRGAAAHGRPRPRGRGHRRGHPDGRGRRQRDHRGRDARRARHRARRDQEALRRAARAGRQGAAARSSRSPRPSVDEDLYRQIEQSHGAQLDQATSVQDKLERQDATKAVEEEVLEQYSGEPSAETYAEFRARAQLAFDKLEKNMIRQRIAVHKKRPDGRSEQEIRADLDRGRHPAAHARLRAVHARADAGAVGGRARHDARGDAPGQPRARDVQALLPPLQLPAVLGGRGRLHARPEAPRHRPRRARRARAGPDDPVAGGVPRTRSASCRTSSSPTARRRWPRCAAPRCR